MSWTGRLGRTVTAILAWALSYSISSPPSRRSPAGQGACRPARPARRGRIRRRPGNWQTESIPRLTLVLALLDISQHPGDVPLDQELHQTLRYRYEDPDELAVVCNRERLAVHARLFDLGGRQVADPDGTDHRRLDRAAVGVSGRSRGIQQSLQFLDGLPAFRGLNHGLAQHSRGEGQDWRYARSGLVRSGGACLSRRTASRRFRGRAGKGLLAFGDAVPDPGPVVKNKVFQPARRRRD